MNSFEVCSLVEWFGKFALRQGTLSWKIAPKWGKDNRNPGHNAIQVWLKCIIIRPWPNDQTLLIWHLKYACEAKFLTVKPRPKTSLVQHFFAWVKQKKFLIFFKNITPQILLILNCQAMFERFAAFRTLSNIECQTFLLFWTAATTCNISPPSNISQQQGVCACALAIKSLLDSNVFGRGQPVKHML